MRRLFVARSVLPNSFAMALSPRFESFNEDTTVKKESCSSGSDVSTTSSSDDSSSSSPLGGDAQSIKRSPPPGVTPEQNAAAREALIQEIISRDKEIFELKRQHELSMLRVEQNQKRILKDQEDRGMYYEQNCNVATFDTISVGLYTQRNTLYHAMGVERLRNFKIFLTVFVAIMICAYLYYRYMLNSDFEYVERPLSLLGSRSSAIREIRWSTMSEEERKKVLREKETFYAENRLEGH